MRYYGFSGVRVGVKVERVGGQKTGSWELTAIHDTLQTFQLSSVFS